MKILQVIDSLPPTSGGSRFVANLSKELAARAMKVDVLLVDGKDSHFVNELESNGIHVIKLDINARSRFRIKYILQIARVMKGYNIIHVHVFPASYLVALATFFNATVPLVFTEHSSYNRRATHKIFRFIEKIIYSRFKIIVCLSEQVYSFVQKNLNTPASKLRIIQNAIDSEAVNKAIPYSKERLGFKRSDFLILMSSRLDADKRHDLLIEAMTLLEDNVKLIFAGDGVTKSNLQCLVKNLNLTERVVFLGARQDVFRLMKSVDINILASNFEGLSLAALEAMSSSKPFIASNVEGLDFVVNDKRLLFENDSVSIAKMIKSLTEDDAWRAEASKISEDRAKMFNIQEMTNEYIKVYEEF